MACKNWLFGKASGGPVRRLMQVLVNVLQLESWVMLCTCFGTQKAQGGLCFVITCRNRELGIPSGVLSEVWCKF